MFQRRNVEEQMMAGVLVGVTIVSREETRET